MREINLGIEGEATAIRKHMDVINGELEKIRKVLAPLEKGSGKQYLDDTIKQLFRDMVDDGYSQTVIANKLDIPRGSLKNAISNRRKKR